MKVIELEPIMSSDLEVTVRNYGDYTNDGIWYTGKFGKMPISIAPFIIESIYKGKDGKLIISIYG